MAPSHAPPMLASTPTKRFVYVPVIARPLHPPKHGRPPLPKETKTETDSRVKRICIDNGQVKACTTNAKLDHAQPNIDTDTADSDAVSPNKPPQSKPADNTSTDPSSTTTITTTTATTTTITDMDALKDVKQFKKRKHNKPRRHDHRHICKHAFEPAIDAVRVVKDNLKPYAHFAPEGGKVIDNVDTVVLEYPGDDARETFPLVYPTRNADCEYNPINDIYITTHLISQYCLSPIHRDLLGDDRHGVIRNIVKACNKRDVDLLKRGVMEFNKVVEAGRIDVASIGCAGPPAGFELISHVLEQAYARSVAPMSHMLNNYQGFSNNVYGEIRQPFVHDLIKNAGIKPHHVFLDMGSGIGNVILQVAAECLCDTYGIEIMDIPNALANKQKAEFLSRMRYYGKPCGKVTIRHGDFLDDPEIHEVIRRADVIFVNNYAFNATLNQYILAKFLDLKDTAKVVSLRSFVPVNQRQSKRRANAIESIFSVREYVFGRDCVSWMGEGGKYFIHSVERGRVGADGGSGI